MCCSVRGRFLGMGAERFFVIRVMLVIQAILQVCAMFASLVANRLKH